MAIAISTSGNSPNVLGAITTAKKLNLHTVAVTGCTGGKLRLAVDDYIRVASDDTPRIQECDILIGHILSELVEQELFAQTGQVFQR